MNTIPSNIDILHQITEIYHSELPIFLKHDCACRIIGKSLGANLVSIFEYSGNKDELICVGNFINTTSKYPKYLEEGLKYKEVLENISLFEFFEFTEISNKIHSANFNLYKQNKLFYSENTETTLFDEIKKSWISKMRLYTRYKAKLKSESYNLNKKHFTSRYFQSLLKNKIAPIIFDLNLAKNNLKICYTTYKKSLGLEIDCNSLYIGLPLVAGNRCFGIIRILLDNENELLEENTFIESSKLFFESLYQILSLHLNIQSLFEGYKNITSADLINLNLASLNKECNILVDVINVYGVLIRLPGINNLKPKVVGYSDKLRPYANWLNEYGDFYLSEHGYHEEIQSVFYPNQTTKKASNAEKTPKQSVVAVKLKFVKDSKSFKLLNQTFYFHEQGHLKETDNINTLNDYRSYKISIDKFFTSEILEKIVGEFNIHEIIVIKIPKVQLGLATFASTVNRSFNKSDVEMMHSILQKMGYEIKHLVDERANLDESEKLSTLETTEIIVHQLTAPINSIQQLAKNLIEIPSKKNDVNEKLAFVDKNLRFLSNKTEFAKQQVKTIEKFLQWETNGIIHTSVPAYRLIDYLKKRSHIYRDMALSKGLQIHVFDDNKPFHDQLNIDPKLFDEIMNCILDNAVKYSFHASELSINNIAFDTKNVGSQGHIHIAVTSTPEKLEIQFINWGCGIDDDERDEVFKFKKKGKHAHIKSTTGNGIGLYMVKQIVDALSGTISVLHKDKKTTFTLSLNR